MQKVSIYNKVLGVALGLAIAMPAFSANKVTTATITNPELVRNGSLVTATMDVSFSDLKVKSAGANVIQPMIVNGADTLRLPVVGVYGRTAWYQAERNDRMPLGGTEGSSMRYKKNLAPMQYMESVPYADWMNGAQLVVDQTSYGCAGCAKNKETLDELVYLQNTGVGPAPSIFQPTLIYQAVVADSVKNRELSGRAFVDFPVNLTEIYPTYRNNEVELAKIIATIDSVRNDEDITVTSISIKGFASPEGPYNNNIRLAKGRTAALKAYVQSLYKFPEGFIKTSYEPEDWDGLVEYLISHDLENTAGILAIINSGLAPDPKNTKIQTTYPTQYKFLLQNVYPALRHSDYTIQYNIRTFSDPVEIREILFSKPSKLSLGEMYIALRGLEVGSDEYNKVFEIAAVLYPNEPAANLNAANAALQRGDIVKAAEYLEKAGDSAEAVYARGMYNAMSGDYKEALKLIEKASAMGLDIDQTVIDTVRAGASR